MEMKGLFEKFINRECSREEIQQIIAYFRTSKDLPDFPTIENVSALLNQFPDMDDALADRMFENIVRPAPERKQLFDYRKIAVAASLFIGVLVGGYLYQQGYFTANSEALLTPVNEAITLELDNGTIEVIAENGEAKIMDNNGQIVGRQQGNQLVYSDEVILEELVYNTLTVPYGKRFDVQLSDGTVVYLNAGTSIKYPLKFISGENRQVFLTGEAFFKVKEDKDHPFIVNAEKLNVQVLGTAFNVSNYPEDGQTDVVLVEGAVGMYKSGEHFSEEEHTILAPGTKGSFDRTNTTIEIRDVLTSTYTSWVDGRLIFRNMPFDNILKKLERRYNIEILNFNKSLGAEEFNAGFKDESIDEILDALKTTYGIDYKIRDNKVIIE